MIMRKGVFGVNVNFWKDSDQTADIVWSGNLLYSITKTCLYNLDPLNSFGAKFQTTFVVCFSFFKKLSLEKKFIRKVERLNVKQHRSRWDGSYEPSHLDLCCLQKPIIIACGSEKVKPRFYIVKLGFTGVYIIFLIFAQKHRLWVLVRTA